MPMRAKLAVVCGGTQGIGFASAVALAEYGCSVLLLARDAGRLETARGRLPADFPDQLHRTLVADLSDPAAAAAALGAALRDGLRRPRCS
ncbi:MAG: SDR family NAD(P)-dependent oxidoreductase [Gemmatimonadales bacterium]